MKHCNMAEEIGRLKAEIKHPPMSDFGRMLFDFGRDTMRASTGLPPRDATEAELLDSIKEASKILYGGSK